MIYDVYRSQVDSRHWCVEHEDSDEYAIFEGPSAEDRAHEYAEWMSAKHIQKPHRLQPPLEFEKVG